MNSVGVCPVIDCNFRYKLIRSIRLKRAAQLLQNYQLSIVEITDMVGFNTPRYFTKCFKETFGILPSEYSNAHRKK